MIKKAIAVILCATLAIGMVACNKNKTPEAREKMLVQKISQAKSMDIDMKLNMGMNIPDMGAQNITFNANLKTDTNGTFPKISMDGTMGVENLMNLPVKLYIDEQGAVISMMGQNQSSPMTDEMKKQITDSLAKANEQSGTANADLIRTVEEIDYNGQRALKSTYDVTQINQLFSSAMAAQNVPVDDTNITKAEVIYVTDKEEIKQIIADATVSSDGQEMNAHVEITINSMGQPVTITPLSADNTAPTFPFSPAA